MSQWAAATVISLQEADYRVLQYTKLFYHFFWCARTTIPGNHDATPSIKINKYHQSIWEINHFIYWQKGSAMVKVLHSRKCLLHYLYCPSALWRKGYFWNIQFLHPCMPLCSSSLIPSLFYLVFFSEVIFDQEFHIHLSEPVHTLSEFFSDAFVRQC